MGAAPVDLRSDTVTQPTAAMRDAMLAARLGDDVLGDDPTVRRLEETVAAMLGKERALFVPSGTMANALGLLSQTRPGEEVLCHQRSHVIDWEAGGYAALGGLTTRLLPGEGGRFSAEALADAVRVDNPHFPVSRLVVIENTHNRSGGAPWPLTEVAAVADRARSLGLRVHMDGARLWNACVAVGCDPADYARSTDTVAVCFSKGLGCPVGSMIAGDNETMARAMRQRKMLGGGMRQSGVLAAAALYALEHHRDRIVDDHRRALRFAERLVGTLGVTIEPECTPTNMVYFDIDPSIGTAAEFCQRVAGEVRMFATGPQTIRAVVHLHIEDADIDRSAAAIVAAIGCSG